jgi:hypothetical protein
VFLGDKLFLMISIVDNSEGDGSEEGRANEVTRYISRGPGNTHEREGAAKLRERVE